MDSMLVIRGKKILFFCLFILATIFTFQHSSVTYAGFIPQDERAYYARIERVRKYAKFVPGELIVKIKRTSLGMNSLRRLNTEFEVQLVERVFKRVEEDEIGLSRIYKLVIPLSSDVPDAALHYAADENVEYTEPNYIVYIMETLPSDPYFSKQYGLHNTGQTGGKEDADIDAPEAWELAKGREEIVVSIIDTGVDRDHVDLTQNMWVNEDEISDNNEDDDNNGFIDDYYGWDFHNNDSSPMDGHDHGTHCSGIASAVTDNNIGIAGVAWNCKIMAVQCLSSDGKGYTDNCAKAIQYAVDNGAKVLSMSWGSGSPSQLLEDALEYAWSKGCITVAAAGNDDSESPSYPGGYTTENGYTRINIIGVGATDHDDKKPSWSNYGSWVTLFAPGDYIYSTIRNNKYELFRGTSMATPHVSGAAALVFCRDTVQTNGEVREKLKMSVDLMKLPYGKGRLNIRKALTKVLTGSICGYIKDADTGQPIADVRVRAIGPNVSPWELTDEDGHFCIKYLEPTVDEKTEYRVMARKREYQSFRRSGVQVHSSETTSMVIYLIPR